MNIYLEAIRVTLTPEVVAGLIGGLLGAIITIRIELHGLRLSILFAIGSIINAGAVSEALISSWSIYSLYAQGGIGIMVAIISNALLDKLHAKAPKLVGRVIEVIEEDILLAIKEVIITAKDSLVRQIKIIFRDRG